MTNQMISLYISRSFVMDLFQIQISHLFSSESLMSNIGISSHGALVHRVHVCCCCCCRWDVRRISHGGVIFKSSLSESYSRWAHVAQVQLKSSHACACEVVAVVVMAPIVRWLSQHDDNNIQGFCKYWLINSTDGFGCVDAALPRSSSPTSGCIINLR